MIKKTKLTFSKGKTFLKSFYKIIKNAHSYSNQHWTGEWVNELRIERIKCIVSEKKR